MYRLLSSVFVYVFLFFDIILKMKSIFWLWGEKCINMLNTSISPECVHIIFCNVAQLLRTNMFTEFYTFTVNLVYSFLYIYYINSITFSLVTK